MRTNRLIIWKVEMLTTRVRIAIPGALLFLAVLVAGCREPQDPTESPGSTAPSALITDAAHDPTVEGFYFLRPMVSDPTFSGVFNPDLLPVVEICELTADPTTDPGAACRMDREPIRVFRSEVRLVLEDEHYLVPWHAPEDELDAEKFYRISVFGSFRLDDTVDPPAIRGSILLGFADVDVVNNGSEVDGVDREELLPLVRTWSLPIKFRIEQGALCNARARANPEADLDCTDTTARIVDDGGGDVVVPSKEAAGRFQAGWIPQAALEAGITEVTVLVTRVSLSEGESCLFDPGTGQGQILDERESCYQWTTEPKLGREFSADGSFQVFEADVIAAQCRDPEITEAIVQQFQLHQFDPDLAEAGDPPSGVVALESRSDADDLIDCSNFVVLDFGSGPLAELAELGWRSVGRPLARLVLPGRLWAATEKGLGGLAKAFSPTNIGWARALEMTLVAGDGQTGALGATLPVAPTVELVATHPPGAGDPPVPNVEVTFTVTSGGGTLSAVEDDGSSSLTVTTDNAGQAGVLWTLGPEVGTQTLEATAEAFGSPVVFTAEAVAAAQILFDNGSSSGLQSNFANTAGGQELFEDLTLTRDARITIIRWQQHDHNDATYLSTQILVFAGLPFDSPPVFNSTVVADRTPNQTGTLFGEWNGFDYEISGLAINLPAGNYWLGLNSSFEGTRSGWDNTTGGPNTISGFRLVNASNPPPGRVIDLNLAFTVLGIELRPLAAVPLATFSLPDASPGRRITRLEQRPDGGLLSGRVVEIDGVEHLELIAMELDGTVSIVGSIPSVRSNIDFVDIDFGSDGSLYGTLSNDFSMFRLDPEGTLTQVDDSGWGDGSVR